MSKNITWTAGAMSALTLVLTCKNIACATQSILVVTQMGRCAVLHCVALLHCVSLLGHKWAGVTRMNRARDVQHRALDHTRKHGHVVLTMYTRIHKTHTHKHFHEPKYVVCMCMGGRFGLAKSDQGWEGRGQPGADIHNILNTGFNAHMQPAILTLRDAGSARLSEITMQLKIIKKSMTSQNI